MTRRPASTVHLYHWIRLWVKSMINQSEFCVKERNKFFSIVQDFSSFSSATRYEYVLGLRVNCIQALDYKCVVIQIPPIVQL